jgi:cysteine desulfurase / selenocysteine lyase
MMDVCEARSLFPALATKTYFNTSAVGLGNTRLQKQYTSSISHWMNEGFDFVRGEAAADNSRKIFSRLLGVSADDVALVASVSAAAGLVAAQFMSGKPGENIVVGEEEYSSNQFPWRQLEKRNYEVRQAPFRMGGICPEEVENLVDEGTKLIAVSSVQTASGHRTDIKWISDIAKSVGAWLFVDGSQSVGALSMREEINLIDFLSTSDHKYLLNAGRGMGYLYIKPELQSEIIPFNAGWKAGSVPFQSFFGPKMDLSETASRFDNSVSWLAAIGDEICLQLMEEIGFDEIFQQNNLLGTTLRNKLSDKGIQSIDLPVLNQSHIVSVPIGIREPNSILSALNERNVVGSIRNQHLRLAPHFYNNEADIETCVAAVSLALE